MSRRPSLAGAGADRYCIRSDYVPRSGEAMGHAWRGGAEYWTSRRLDEAASYQYDVYRHAGARLRAGFGRSVLDVGAGYPAKIRHLIAPWTSDITLVDHPSLGPIVARDFPELEFVALDLERPEVDLGRRYDVLICADVLEHLCDPDPCRRFVARHAHPASQIVLSTPEREITRGMSCVSRPKPEHVREWSRREFASCVESRGFELVEHRLFPKKRLTWGDSPLRRWLEGIVRANRWSGYQMAVCVPGAERVLD